jgi:hypothetical protein
VTAVEVLAANEVRVLVDARDGYTPTPALSLAVLAHNRAAGRRGGSPTGSSSLRRTIRLLMAGSSTTHPTAVRPAPK